MTSARKVTQHITDVLQAVLTSTTNTHFFATDTCHIFKCLTHDRDKYTQLRGLTQQILKII